MNENQSNIQLKGEHEVARLLSVSVKTLQSWRLKGTGPQFVKLNRSVRYDIADIKEFLAKNRKSNTCQVEARHD